AQAVVDDISFEHAVTRIEWRRGAVRVTARTAAGERTFTAPRAIITLPIGVLQVPAGQDGHVAFDPDPAPFRTAIDQLSPGAVLRVVLLFTDRFWESTHLPGLPRHGSLADAMYLHTPRG